MNAQKVILIITDPGDPSVGIFSQTWEVPYPLLLDIANLDEGDKDELNFFREQIVETYQQFGESKCYGEYDFEIKQAIADEKFIDDSVEELRKSIDDYNQFN